VPPKEKKREWRDVVFLDNLQNIVYLRPSYSSHGSILWIPIKFAKES
jgi:hypothetical protein